MKLYVFQDNSMVFIRVADLLKQQHFNQFFRSFQAMIEEIFIQPRNLFCNPILTLTEIFLRGRDNIIDIELLSLATHKVFWCINTPIPPINVASVGAFKVIICVFALGHDPILAYTAPTFFQLVVQVD